MVDIQTLNCGRSWAAVCGGSSQGYRNWLSGNAGEFDGPFLLLVKGARRIDNQAACLQKFGSAQQNSFGPYAGAAERVLESSLRESKVTAVSFALQNNRLASTHKKHRIDKLTHRCTAIPNAGC